MNRNAWIVLIIGVLLIGGLYGYSKKSPSIAPYTNGGNSIGTTTAPNNSNASTTSDVIHPYGKIDVRVGQEVNYPEGYLKVVSVDEDSRCPTGVQCIWAGTVKITLEFTLRGVVKKQTLELNKSVIRGNEKIILVDVKPQAIQGKKLTNNDYVLTLEVLKTTSSSSGSATASGGCFIGGCSGQICSDQKDAVSTCEYSAKYACYKTAKCERQQNGQCGWTETSELKMCLANAG